MHRDNGSTDLPMHKGRVNTAELTRRYLRDHKDTDYVPKIRKGVKQQYGYTPPDATIYRILREMNFAPQGASEPAREVSPIEVPIKRSSNVVELVRQARIFLAMAGGKDAAKELIDVL